MSAHKFPLEDKEGGGEEGGGKVRLSDKMPCHRFLSFLVIRGQVSNDLDLLKATEGLPLTSTEAALVPTPLHGKHTRPLALNVNVPDFQKTCFKNSFLFRRGRTSPHRFADSHICPREALRH